MAKSQTSRGTSVAGRQVSSAQVAPRELKAREDLRDFGALRYNAQSIKERKEFGSRIYEVNIEGTTYVNYNDVVIGSEAGVTSKAVPEGKKYVGRVHSHGAYSKRHDNNVFSGRPGDISERGDIRTAEMHGVDSYVSTPNGSLLKYDVETDKISTMRTDIPSDNKDPDRKNKIDP